MSCNTKTSLAAVIDAVNAQLNNNYVDRDDPRINQGVFTEPTIRGGLMLDEAAKLDFCGYVSECGQREPFGKQWVDRPLYPYNTLVSYEDEGEIKSRWQDIDDVVAGTEIGESYTAYEETRNLGLQGYTIIDSFELGATLTQRNQALRHTADGKLYRWAGDLPKDVPANSTPTSSGGMGDNAWLEVSDVTLRQDLTNPDKGAAMVARGVVAVDSIADLLALSDGQRKDGLRYEVAGYRAAGDGGLGSYTWSDTSTHNAVTAISPSAPLPSDWEDSVQIDAWFNYEGTGCFVSVQNKICVRGAGVLPDTGEDLTYLINKVLSVAASVQVPVIFPGGQFLINADDGTTNKLASGRGVTIPSGSVIHMSPNTTLKALPTSIGTYSVLTIESVENVFLRTNGARIIGERHEHTGDGGEHGHCVTIQDCLNIDIDELNTREAWGDGVYINGESVGTSKNIKVRKISARDCRRQGVSIISVDGFECDTILAEDIQGTPPMAGVDFEPNGASQELINIEIGKVVVRRAFLGMTINTQKMSNLSKDVSINIGHFVTEDCSVGFLYSEGRDNENTPKGLMTIDRYTSVRDVQSVRISRKPSDTVFLDIGRLECFESRMSEGAENDTGILMFGTTTNDQKLSPVGGFSIRSIKTDRHGNDHDIAYIDKRGRGFNNIYIDETGAREGGLRNAFPATTSMIYGTNNSRLDFISNNYKQHPIELTESQAIKSDVFPRAYTNISADSSITLTLPSSAPRGMVVTIMTDNLNRGVTISSVGGKRIRFSGDLETTSIVKPVRVYGYITLMLMAEVAPSGSSIPEGHWHVLDISGEWGIVPADGA